MKNVKQGHLTENAVLRAQIGDLSALEQAHVAACPDCQAQTKPVADALRCFGMAARQWGAEQAAVPRRPQEPVQARRWLPLAAGCTALCVALLIVIGLVIPRWQAHHAALSAQVQQRQEQQDLVKDNALLEEVDRDVSQVVPDAMQPLSWGNADTTTRQ